MSANGMTGAELLCPPFWQRVVQPEVRTVLVCGCGGGFDFVHSMTLVPALKAAGKRVVISSFSFALPGVHYDDEEETPVVWPLDGSRPGWLVKRVTATSGSGKIYAPEKHVASFLDGSDAAAAPHYVYACNARAFGPGRLLQWYERLVELEEVDAVLCFDGGSDSLMAGDEEGLGDPLEDATSVCALSALRSARLKARPVLLSVGFGCDRFNGVSDAASMRAVAELQQAGGVLGTWLLAEPFAGVDYYRRCVQHIYAAQEFRSVLTGMLLTAMRGGYGWLHPDDTGSRGSSDTCFVWPLMALLLAFDVDKVRARSLTCAAIADCTDTDETYAAFKAMRHGLRAAGRIRSVENLPRHDQTPRLSKRQLTRKKRTLP